MKFVCVWDSEFGSDSDVYSDTDLVSLWFRFWSCCLFTVILNPVLMQNVCLYINFKSHTKSHFISFFLFLFCLFFVKIRNRNLNQVPIVCVYGLESGSESDLFVCEILKLVLIWWWFLFVVTAILNLVQILTVILNLVVTLNEILWFLLWKVIRIQFYVHCDSEPGSDVCWDSEFCL